MIYLVGMGNELRGEDAFGLDVVKSFSQNCKFKCIQTHQLLPEHCLELKDATKIVFVDASYGSSYTLAVPLPSYEHRISHQLSPFILMQMLVSLYGVNIPFYIFSMQTKSFEEINDYSKYQSMVDITKESILKF
ncbi:MAG: hypothetical protein ACQERD_02345 [Campylobacterota bacterium]